MTTDYLTRTRDARPRPVPRPWYAARCRACGHVSEPQATPEGLPTACPRCKEA